MPGDPTGTLLGGNTLAGALGLGGAASGIRPLAAPLSRFATTGLAGLAVDPAFALVLGEPLLQAVLLCFFLCHQQ